MDTSGNPIVYHADGLGSVRALTDSSGSVVQSYQYDEYGVPASTQGSIDQPLRYTGEQYDPETGFVYLRARMYDPGSGRFIGMDPGAGAITRPLDLQRYAYVNNRPLTLTDPTGLSPFERGLPLLGRTPDYYSFSVNAGPPTVPVGGTVQVVVDRYAHIYAGPGGNVGKSLTAVSANMSGGYLLRLEEPPKEEELHDLIKGWGANVSLGCGLGGGVTWLGFPAWDGFPDPQGLMDRLALEWGLYSPQVGAAATYLWQLR